MAKKSNTQIKEELLLAAVNTILYFPPPKFNHALFYIYVDCGRLEEATELLKKVVEDKKNES